MTTGTLTADGSVRGFTRGGEGVASRTCGDWWCGAAGMYGMGGEGYTSAAVVDVTNLTHPGVRSANPPYRRGSWW